MTTKNLSSKMNSNTNNRSNFMIFVEATMQEIKTPLIQKKL